MDEFHANPMKGTSFNIGDEGDLSDNTKKG